MTASQITVPATIEAAGASLASLDGLVTAREWERAAIVYAFTTDGRTIGENPPIVSQSVFAGLRIVGLRDRHTVAAYRAAWQDAVDQGKAIAATPGAIVTMPDLPFPPISVGRTGRNVRQGRRDAIEAEAERQGARGAAKAIDIAGNPRAMSIAIAADDATATAATEALTSNPASAERTYQAARKAMIDQSREAAPQAAAPEPPPERVIRIEAVADEVIRDLAEILDPDTDPLGQKAAFLEQNLEALSERYRQRLGRAFIELGARVSAWEDRVRGLTGHTVG